MVWRPSVSISDSDVTELRYCLEPAWKMFDNSRGRCILTKLMVLVRGDRVVEEKSGKFAVYSERS